MSNMEINYMIIGQCGKSLIDDRETTNNENGPQDSSVHPNECEQMCCSRAPIGLSNQKSIVKNLLTEHMKTCR